jgi:Ca-activated chloride channel family protein
MSGRIPPLVRALLVFLILASAGAERHVVGEARQVDPARPAFRSGIDMVSLNVTVTSSDQRYVSGLTQSDFTVLEDGVPQPLRYFAKSGVPLSMALLIDTSASMKETLSIAQEAAIGFVRQVADGDVVSIIDFETRVEISQELTGDLGALERAIRGTQVGGATSLYNALDIAYRELSKPMPGNAGAPRRRVIIVLSDGADTSSVVTFDQVLDRAVRSDTVIYGISLGSGQRSTGRLEEESGERVLRRLARQTGGRAFFTDKAEDLTRVYAQIRDELANQYTLGYESTAKADGKWRLLDVRVDRPNTTVRSRAGYFAASP